MNGDTITTAQIADLALFLRLASESMERTWREATEGEITTNQAAADVREILANVNALGK